MDELLNQVKNKISELSGDIIYIHSDVTRGFKILSRDRFQLLEQHYNAIESVCNGLDIWMPAFNYDYCDTGNFNVDEDRSQVGVLSEFFRKNKAEWRYPMPVFSFSGIGKYPVLVKEKVMDPFGTNSLFAYLYNHNALVMFYGTSIASNTIIHYAEKVSNSLIYRYQKQFPGKISQQNNNMQFTLNFHVRPMGASFEYDYNKTQNDLISRGILHSVNDNHTQIHIARVDKMVNYYLEMLSKDPFYLLTEETKLHLSKIYNNLKRPFVISDFE